MSLGTGAGSLTLPKFYLATLNDGKKSINANRECTKIHCRSNYTELFVMDEELSGIAK